MIYLYIGIGIYLATSLFLSAKWLIRKIKLRKSSKEVREAEDKDPFFDKFYPHF